MSVYIASHLKVIDKKLVLALLLLLPGLVLPFFTFKENRVVSGEGVSLLRFSPPFFGTGLFLVLLLATLILKQADGSMNMSKVSTRFPVQYYTQHLTQYLVGYLFLVYPFIVLAAAAAYPALNLFEFGRLSFGGGFIFWLSASFVILYSAARELTSSFWVKIFPLVALALLFAALVLGFFDHVSVVKEFAAKKSRFYYQLSNHLIICGVATLSAVIVGIPLGILSWKKAALRRPVFAFVNGIQTIPSLAFFGLIIGPLALLSRAFPLLRQLGIKGIGNTPAIIALTLYALLPIVRNTFTSFEVLDRSIIESGRGMGMNRKQLLFWVEIPIAAPIILTGVRTSAVQVVGNTTVAALIGAGGFGTFIFEGFGQASNDLILLGAIPVIALALLVDRGMELISR